MPKALLMIFAYGGGQKVFDFNLPLWERLGLPIAVCCPSDDRIGTKYPVFYNGESSYIGPKAVYRLHSNLRWFLTTDFDYAVICEYDSFPIVDNLTLTPGIQGTIHYNLDYIRFMSLRFALCPWIIDRESVAALVNVAAKYPGIQEEGYDDRLLSAWAQYANVPLLSHRPRGFARDTLTPANYGELRQAIREGVKFFHGIKTVEMRDFICREAGIAV